MSSKNINYINFLNVISCISVIALHCNGCFWQFADASYWKTSVFIETFFYPAVPLFFMIMGVTLLNYQKKYDTKTFLRKRLLRTVVPFIAWSIIAIVFNQVFTRNKISLDAVTIINAILHTKPMPVYWFFPPLFAVYLSIPVLAWTDETKKKAVYSYGVIAAFVTISLLPCLFTLTGLKYNGSIHIEAVSGYLLYVLLGYLLEYEYSLTKKQRVIIYILGFAGWFLRFVTVLIWSLQAGKIVNTMGGYLNFPTVFYSVAIFVAIKYNYRSIELYFNKISFNSVLTRISSYSLGVYLVHMYFVSYLPKIFHFSNYSIIWRSAGVLVTYACCVAVVYILKKLPVVQRIVP